MKLTDLRCAKCGETADNLMMLALMEMCGARCHPGAGDCPADGGKHDLVDRAVTVEEVTR